MRFSSLKYVFASFWIRQYILGSFSNKCLQILWRDNRKLFKNFVALKYFYQTCGRAPVPHAPPNGRLSIYGTCFDRVTIERPIKIEQLEYRPIKSSNFEQYYVSLLWGRQTDLLRKLTTNFRTSVVNFNVFSWLFQKHFLKKLLPKSASIGICTEPRLTMKIFKEIWLSFIVYSNVSKIFFWIGQNLKRCASISNRKNGNSGVL